MPQGLPRRLSAADRVALFGHRDSVHAFELFGAADAALCSEPEFNLVKGAHSSRKQTFIAGRLCAKSCLAALGAAPQPLLRRSTGEADWPSGVMGSISHTDGYAIAVVVADSKNHRSVGVDVERINAVTPEVANEVFTPLELFRLTRSTAPWLAAAMFSAKEAFYKAQYPITGAWLAFHDVEIEVANESLLLRPTQNKGIFAVPRGPIAVGVKVAAGLVCTGVMIGA